MKRIILILLWCLGITAYANTYYVATTGDDSDPGTFAEPWATWAKAFYTAQAGDTVYFRGGVYQQTVTTGQGIVIDSRYPLSKGRSGTAENPICYFNYPGETPILDCSNVTPSTMVHRAIVVQFTNYLHFKGLTIRNVLQKIEGKVVEAFYIQWNTTGTNWVENFTIYNVGGNAFSCFPEGTSKIYYTNCDAYNCCDTIATNPGQYGDGFSVDNTSSDSTEVYFSGCRAWNCSDQGYSGRPWGYVKYENCWAFDCKGDYNGDGHGFKPSSPDIERESYPPIQRELVNCIAANNAWSGFDTNDNGRPANRMVWYNNFSYHNGYLSKGSDAGTGFRILNASENRTDRVLRNNLSYANEYAPVTSSAVYTHSHNNWDISVNVADDDFISLDYTQLYGSRKSDGSLPNITFGRLTSSSDLIDAGTDVGLDYTGTAPDLGYIEYGSGELATATDITSFTLAAQTGAATINTTNHTVSIEVAYGTSLTSLTPTISVSYGASIDPPGGTARDFTSPVTYTVTAEDATTTQVWTVTVTVDSAPATSGTVVVGDDWVVHEGKIVKI